MKRSLGAKTLAVPTPVWLVGTYDANGHPNMSTIAWGGIVASAPPAVSVSLRQSRHAHAAILSRRAFTVSIPSAAQAANVDFVGMVSGGTVDKFAATGWTATRSEIVDAPYVAEAVLVLECRLLQAVELGSHTMFIGEIVDVKAEEAILGDNGRPDIAKVAPLVYDTGASRYHAVGEAVGKAYEIGKAVDFR